MNTTQKKCSTCLDFKPIENFHNKKDGKQSKCKVCHKEFQQNNKDKVKESNKKYNDKTKYTRSEKYQLNKTK